MRQDATKTQRKNGGGKPYQWELVARARNPRWANRVAPPHEAAREIHIGQPVQSRLIVLLTSRKGVCSENERATKGEVGEG